MKTLIAYFSRKGDNYVGGKIVNLPVGNTEVAAKKIAELTGGYDLFLPLMIVSVSSYLTIIAGQCPSRVGRCCA